MCYKIYPNDDYSCRTAYYQTGFLYYLLNQYLGKIWGREQLLVPLNHMLKKYYAQTGDQDDLISVGTIGLIKAIDSFNIDNGARFATYAGKCLQNEILMYFRAQKKQSMENSLSDAVDVDKDGNPLTYMDILSVDDDIIDEIDLRIRSAKLYKAISEKLDDRERTVITLRYGLNGGRCYTQREVAERLGISRSYVSRIEKFALEKIREAL